MKAEIAAAKVLPAEVGGGFAVECVIAVVDGAAVSARILEEASYHRLVVAQAEGQLASSKVTLIPNSVRR